MSRSAVRYDNFAVVADEYWRSFGAEFSDLIFSRLVRLFEKHHVCPRRVLDLGCGTGSFAIRMARRGVQVTGLDASRHVLKGARRKAVEARVQIRWVHGDMRNFRLKGRYDTVTSLFNSVNHLLRVSDVRSLFISVYGVLKPGGYFVFDLNNRACFEEVWGGTSLVSTRHGIVIRSDRLDPRRRRASARMMLFLKSGKFYRLKKDSIEERWFEPETIIKEVRRAGLRLVSHEEFNPFSKRLGYSKDIKSLWLLRRPSE